MSDLLTRCRINTKARRHFLLGFAAVVFVVGCGQPEAPVAVPFVVPDEFSDSSGSWKRIEGDASKADIQLIGKFFDKHTELVGSPDWTGQPEKYVCKKTKSLKRFYWFSGTSENPSWNAIESKGSQLRQLGGTGAPGVESQE